MTDDTVALPAGFTLDAPSAKVAPPPGFTLDTPATASTPEQPARSGVSDIVHGAGMGLMRGAGYVLGMPSDVWHMLDRGYQHLMTRSAVAMGILTPEQGEALRQPIPGAEDYQSGSEKINEHLLDLARKAGADTSEPSTRAGQAAENVISFVPGAVSLGANSVRAIPRAAVRYGLVPGAASETAGQATKGTALEPYARLAGAFAPAAIGLAASAATRAMSPMTGVLKGVSPQQQAAAQRILEESRTAGAPLTVPEAVQQATGSGTRIGDLQRVVEQSPRGAEIMRPFMAERPGQIEALGRSVFGDVAPVADPYEVPAQVQRAAQQVLDTSPQAAMLNRSVTALGPSITAEEAGNVIQPELHRVYAGREGMRNALADQDYAAARNAPIPPPAEIIPRQPIVAPPSFMPPGSNVPLLPRINALISEDARLGATRPTEIPPSAPQPINPLSTAPGTVPHAIEYGETLQGQVDINPVISHVNDMLTSAKGGVAAALRKARSTFLMNGQPDTTVQGLSNARNAISDQISAASRTGNNQVASALRVVQNRLDSALEDVPAYGQARQNFARASEPLAPFAEGTAPGRIIDRDQFNRGFTMPAERVAPTIERGGPSAVDQFLTAAENAPASRQAFGQYYSQQLLSSATDATGRINPDVLVNTLRNNHDMLQRFPEISVNLNRIGAARRALQELEQTPVGALASSVGKTGQEQFATQRSLLFASNPLAGSERTIANTVRAVAGRDPVAAQAFVRQHLEQAFNEATQNNLPGANQFGGPKFAAVVAGNSQQAKNLEAAVRALPNGDLRWNALRKGLDIMEGMGTRQPVGSQTSYNTQIQKILSQGSPGAEAAVHAATPGAWMTIARDIYRRVMFDRNTGALANLFTTGSVADLRAIAGAGRRSVAGQLALVAAMGRQGFQSVPAARPSQSP